MDGTTTGEYRLPRDMIFPSVTFSLASQRSIASPHLHISIVHQYANASELHPLRLSILREGLHVELQYQVRQHELQRADREETTGTVKYIRILSPSNVTITKQRQHNRNSPSMLPQSKRHISSRDLHSADLTFVRHRCLRRLLTLFGHLFAVPRWPERVPILPLAGKA
jgi:hypothetical protein